MDTTTFYFVLLVGVNIGVSGLALYRCTKLKLTSFVKYNLIPLSLIALAYCILSAFLDLYLLNGNYTGIRTTGMLVYLLLPLRNAIAGYNYFVRFKSIFFQNKLILHAGWAFIVLSKLFMTIGYFYCFSLYIEDETFLEWITHINQESFMQFYASISLFLGAEGFILDIAMLIQIIKIKSSLNTQYSIHYTRYINIFLVILSTVLSFTLKGVANGAYSLLAYQFDVFVITFSTLVLIDFYEIDVAFISNRSTANVQTKFHSTGGAIEAGGKTI